MKQKNPKNTQNFITSKKHVKEILKYTNINKQDKIIECIFQCNKIKRSLKVRERLIIFNLLK